MMICILCGGELEHIYEYPLGAIKTYRCYNCKIEWDAKDNKLFENWSVRHIRILEEKIELLLKTMEAITHGTI